MRLATFQQRFQAAVIAPMPVATDGELGIEINGSRVAHGIAIHHKHFWTRMHDYVVFRYPLLARYLDDIELAEVIRTYVAAYPPTSVTASAIVEHLVTFLECEPPWSGTPVLAQVAAFDFRRSALRLCREEVTVSAADLQGLEPGVQLRLKKRAMVMTTQLELRPDRIRELPRGAALDAQPTYWLIHIGRRGLVTKKIDRRIYGAMRYLERGIAIGDLVHELGAAGFTSAEIAAFVDRCLREELVVAMEPM